MPSRRAEPIKHDQAQFPARFRILYRVVPSVMLDLLGSSNNSTFSAPSGPLAADEGGQRTGDFCKPVALCGLDIAFGLRFTTPSGVRSTLFTTGPGGPLP